MVTVTISNHNCLGILYEREFVYKNVTYNSIHETLVEGACVSEEELGNMLLERALQHKDILKYLISFGGVLKYHNAPDIVYGTLCMSNIIMEQAYTCVKNKLYVAGAKCEVNQNGIIRIGVTPLTCSYKQNSEMRRIHKILRSYFR